MYPMLLGIQDKILDSLKSFLVFIPKVLYFIISCVLSLIDFCQAGFRKLAGLDPIIISNETYTGDTIYKIITDALFTGRYPAVQTVFWSLIILGVFMLFMTSIVALIRLEYNPDKDKGNSKSGVVKNFFKAIFSFAIIPIACLFGMYLSNALVGIVDTATASNAVTNVEITQRFDKWSAVEDSNQDSAVYGSDTLTSRTSTYLAYDIFGLHIPTTSQPFSGIIFKACAYGSNRIRNSEGFYNIIVQQNYDFLNNSNNQATAAEIVDVGFSINAKLKTPCNLNTSAVEAYFKDSSLGKNAFDWSYSGIKSLSKYNVNAVFYFYNLWTFNYIVAFAAVISIGKLYLSFLLYLMQRLFEIMGLFVISPISVSLMPLDDGNALKTWRSTFASKFILLIIMVGSLNLINPVINICQNIQFFGIKILDYLMLTFFIVAAFNAVDSLNKMFTKIFTGDAGNYSSAMEASKGITDNFKTGLSKTVSGAKIAALPVALGAKYGAKGVKAGVAAGFASAERRMNRRLTRQTENADTTYATAETDYNNNSQRNDATEYAYNRYQNATNQTNADGSVETAKQKARRLWESQDTNLTDEENKKLQESKMQSKYVGESRKSMTAEQKAEDDKAFEEYYKTVSNTATPTNIAYSRKVNEDTLKKAAKTREEEYKKVAETRKKVEDKKKRRAKVARGFAKVGGAVSNDVGGALGNVSDVANAVPGADIANTLITSVLPKKKK